MTVVRARNLDDVVVEPAQWSEAMIANALVHQTFQRKAVVITPNCNWTGYECDLLVVEPRLRIIDVEIKISRADLKADAKKDKWWHRYYSGQYETVPTRHGSWQRPIEARTARQWPPKVWKHYYALPTEVWHDSLLDALPSPASGVIALSYRRGALFASVVRKAKPNRDAHVLTPAQAVNVARLANLRYWDLRKAQDKVSTTETEES